MTNTFRTFITLIFILIFCNTYRAESFLGEDLGLDLYKQIDSGFEELETKHYEYEITGQGETSVGEVIGPILSQAGFECNFNSVEDIESVIGNTEAEQVAFIYERCSIEGERLSNDAIGRVIEETNRIKNDFVRRANNKVDITFDVAKIGLYSDGQLENSPFDLVYDLQEIDKIIFSEEIPYEGEAYDMSDDESHSDHLEEDKDYLYETGSTVQADDDEETGSGVIDEPISEIPEIFDDIITDHSYACVPDDTSGLSDEDLEDILTEIDEETGNDFDPYVRRYDGGLVTNGASWGGPYPAAGPSSEYSEVRDAWACDSFFCIIIEFQKSNYGLIGGNTISIESILKKAAGHLEKPANASLTQRKMTTNNFELGSIIEDLPGMLRGFGIEVQSKPIPILDVESDNEDSAEGDMFEMENLLETYYKNMGMEYSRRNDLDIYEFIAEETKILQTAGGMPTPYTETRLTELSRFQAALEENNRQISLEVDKKVLNDDMEDFVKQFKELERFVAAIEDFAEAVTGSVGQMKQIPTRTP